MQEWLCAYSNFDFLDEWYNPIPLTNNDVNSLGFRNEEITTEKNSDTYRIFVVGGSTVFGDGVKTDETIPQNLQKEFLDDKLNGIENIEVINAGINGAWSKDEAKLIKNKIIKYDPDLIIVYDGWNDAKWGNYNQVREGEIHNEDTWKNRWSGICEKYNDEFEFIVILQPILERGAKKILTNQEFTNLQAREKIQVEAGTLDKYRQHIGLLNEKCSGAYDFKNIVYDVEETVYYDQGHMTPLGNKIVAKKIYELSLPIINKNFKLIESNGNIINEKSIYENKATKGN
jgi:Lysophospholipase L1 and related esterases